MKTDVLHLCAQALANALFKPSLKRRLVFTLLIGTFLIWGLLLVKDYLDYQQKVKQQLGQGQLNRALLMSIERLDARQVETAMAHTHATFEQLNEAGPSSTKARTYFQWRHLATGKVYASDPAVTLPAQPPGNGQVALIGQRAYWPVTQRSTHWQLTIWHPANDEKAALTAMAWDLLGYIAWAFPVLVLLLMWAVWQGFKPLKRLTDHVQHRSPDDIAALTDPTGYAELKPILAAFNEVLDRFRQIRAHEKQFYETVAHELKTPLAVIAGHAHALTMAQDRETQTQSLRVLEKAIEAASMQINQLICLSSLSTASGVTHHSSLDVVQRVRELLIDFMPLGQRRHIELTLDAPEQLCIRVSESALELVMKNLLKNAITYGHEGGRVEVKITQDGRSWTVTVADDGPGLANEQAAHQMNRHGSANGQAPLGTGLGLAIVARAVEVLGGDLVFGPGLNEKGLGVRFVAPLPYPL